MLLRVPESTGLEDALFLVDRQNPVRLDILVCRGHATGPADPQRHTITLNPIQSAGGGHCAKESLPELPLPESGVDLHRGP